MLLNLYPPRLGHRYLAKYPQWDTSKRYIKEIKMKISYTLEDNLTVAVSFPLIVMNILKFNDFCNYSLNVATKKKLPMINY